MIDRAIAVKVNRGFALKDEDTTFIFKGIKYLIQAKELFDKNGEISSAIIYGDVGYTIYSRQEIYRYKNFLTEHNLNRLIDVFIIDTQHIRLNNKTISIKTIDRKQKEVFYAEKDKDVIYRITYK